MIPQRVFTYWEGEWGPDQERCWNSVKEIMPHWQHELLTPDTLPSTLDKRFLFEYLGLRSQRADYIRFFELYERGGFWVDTDIYMLRPFDPLLSQPLVAGYEDKIHINNAVMGAEPGHIVFLYCLMRFPHYARFGRSATAPLLLTEALRFYGLEQEMEPVESFYPIHYTKPKSEFDFEKLTGVRYPKAYCVHRWDWIWRQRE